MSAPENSPPSDHAFFSPEVQKELRAEDKEAWKAIVSVLLFIICVGVMLAITCVLIVTR